MCAETQYIFPPRRELGRTGFTATRMGIGDLADRDVPMEEGVATVRRAMDAGLNVIDTAPGYEDGFSEQIVGEALQGRRDGMFVIDKIDHIDRPVAGQVDQSLGRLQMDRVDCFVFHGVSHEDGWKEIVTERMDELDAQIRAGKCRFRGISSHNPDVMRDAVESGLCDIAMFPVGPFVDPRYVEQILPLCRKNRVGSVCFKAFGAGKLLGDTEGYGRPLSRRPRGKTGSGGQEAEPVLPHLSVAECLHYVFTCDPDVALLGLSSPDEQDVAFAAAADYTERLDQQQMDDIRQRATVAIEGKGDAWWNA
jgi:aryl-alcohol dehydrogenase-like predicted oxidoreductase